MVVVGTVEAVTALVVRSVLVLIISVVGISVEVLVVAMEVDSV